MQSRHIPDNFYVILSQIWSARKPEMSSKFKHWLMKRNNKYVKKIKIIKYKKQKTPHSKGETEHTQQHEQRLDFMINMQYTV